MERHLYAEIGLLCIAVLLMLCFNRKKSTAVTPDQKLFDLLTISAILMNALDTGFWVFDGRQTPLAYSMMQAINLLSYILQLAPPMLWALYCDWKVQEDRKGLRRRAWIYLLPFLVNFALSIANLKTGWLYTINEQNVYQRGPLVWLVWVMTLLYLCHSTALVLNKARHSYSELKREFYYLSTFPLPPIIGCILQIFRYGLFLIWPGVTLSLLMIFIKVQNNQISSDELTGLNNRRRFNQYVASKRLAGPLESDLCALMIDLDNFKTINDTYGHQAGDAALILAANVLKAYCHGKHAFLARTGGDEFVMLLSLPSREDAVQLARQLNDKLAEESIRCGTPCTLGLSAGIAMATDEGVSTIDQMLLSADERMYEVKAKKKAKARSKKDRASQSEAR